MREDSVQYAQAARSPSKEPRYVIRIVFDTASPALTSHSDITSVPGDVIESVLQEPSAVSQRIIPDEGRSEIGSFSFSLVDKDAAFTEKLREKLYDDFEGIRGKEVIFYDGYRGFDFSAFQIFQTQIVQGVSYADGVYKVQCQDITREQRKDVFEPKFTTLRDSVTDAATTIPVYVTTDFETLVHGTSWSDAPSSTVGYIRIENEIIRYTGKTADSFTGCTRGVLNTKAVAHSVDAGTAAERRAKVEEYIYLELPAIKLAWAILTGELYGSADTLPTHWHLGIDPAYLRESDFSGIGLDLWNPSDDAAALPLRFDGLKKTDGKRFLEKEIYLVMGCYSPVYSDGTLGLRRLPALLDDSAPVAILTEREVISAGDLNHDLESMHNVFRVNWNWDVLKEQFTRIALFTDTDSVTINGSAPIKEYSFKGLHGSRHTDVIVTQRLAALRDAYAYPPERISVTVQGSLSYLEIGDVVRLRLQNVRDYAGALNPIDRAFAIFRKTHDSTSNQVTLDLFGSTARPLATAPGTGVTAPLPDAFYTAVGANLNTIATITANVMATGNYTITGNASLTNAGAVYYHAGDLTIPSGCNLTIAANVQLRIRGFLTVNGTINGVGGGHAGVADGGGTPSALTYPGNPGYVGSTRAWDGIIWFFDNLNQLESATPAPVTRGLFDAAPVLNLSVSGSTLQGLPTDLRGTGGGSGGRTYRTAFPPDPNLVLGGTGGNGGAGLAIICRGMAFGVSGSITLSGSSTTNPAFTSPGSSGRRIYPGAGGPGGPGTFLLLLDGNAISIPDISGKFVATVGSLTQAGAYLQRRGLSTPNWAASIGYSGYADEGVTAGLDMSNAAHRIQYIPETQTAAPDADVLPAAPTAVLTQATGEAITYRVTVQFTDPADVLEFWTSIDNDRANAVLRARGRVTEFTRELAVLTTEYAWFRVRRDFSDRIDAFSAWYPSSATGGLEATTLNPGGWTPVRTGASGSTMVVRAGYIQKSGGTTAWDSQVYSREAYLAGCSVAFRAAQTNASFMIGLNTDPTTNASYTSLDHAFQCELNGTLDIWEDNVEVVSNISGGYDTSTVLEIRYDNAFVVYYRNSVEVRRVARAGASFFLDSSWYSPGAAATDVHFGPLNSATPVQLQARVNCRVSGDSITKEGGSSAWDSDAYSMLAYTTSHVVFKANQANAEIMVGLTLNPTADSTYTGLRAAFHLESDGTWEVHELGSAVVVGGAYTTSTEFAITYDGTNIRYYVDRVLARTENYPTQTLYLDSSFFTPGAGVNSVRFGPGANLALIDTPQIGDNAITEPYVLTEPSDGSQAYSATTQPAVELNGLDGVASYTAPSSTDVQVRASWSGQGQISNTTSGAAVGEARISVRVFINSVEVWSQWLVLEGYSAAGDWGSFAGVRDFTVPAGQDIDVYLQTGRNFSTSGASPAQTMYWRDALINIVGAKR
jgi:hypothetical protein